MTDDHVPPHDLGAERAVLGAILIDAAQLAGVAEVLDPLMFWRAPHAVIFRRMLALRDEKASIDFVTLRQALDQANELNLVGGPAYISALSDGAVASNAVDHARIVANLSGRRNLIEAGGRVIDLARTEDGAVDELVRRGQIIIGRVPTATRSNHFTRLGHGRYQMVSPDCDVALTVEGLRLERRELVGDLRVLSSLPGGRTVDGVLSVGELKYSSVRAREERAKHLHERAPGRDRDWWLNLLEELTLRLDAAERAGQPAVLLHELPAPGGPEEAFAIDGLVLPKTHPSCLFGDGGSGKSYFALYIAGRLAQQGVNVGLFDWEFTGDEHRARLERLFPQEMPPIRYLRMERPLAVDVERLRRVVDDFALTYTIIDSVVFACDGKPEDADVAGRYFSALRQLGIGTLNIAHISKAGATGDGNDSRPFGSAFFWNGCRSIWFIKRGEESAARCLSFSLQHRKSNIGALRPTLAFELAFEDRSTLVLRTNRDSENELADHLRLKERIAVALKHGAQPIHRIAEVVNAKKDSVTKALQRDENTLFIRTEGPKGVQQWGLLERHA